MPSIGHQYLRNVFLGHSMIIDTDIVSSQNNILKSHKSNYTALIWITGFIINNSTTNTNNIYLKIFWVWNLEQEGHKLFPNYRSAHICCRAVHMVHDHPMIYKFRVLPKEFSQGSPNPFAISALPVLISDRFIMVIL